MSKDFLPSGWVSRTLEDVVEINPRLDKKLFSDDMDISFVPMSAVETENGKIDISEIRSFGDVKKGYTAFQEKDVLFAKITPCMENGKMAVVPKLKNNLGFGSTEFHVLRSLTNILPEYIYYFVSSKQFRIDAEHNMTGAVGQRRVPTTYFQNVSIPLPEYTEQKSIVAKIEELFFELDSGIASLKTAQEQLKTYRQALLKHAFEGKLTEQWRKDNADKLETPEQLLARIQTEREARYQQQLKEWKQAVKDWEAKGKGGKKPSKPNKQLVSFDEITDEELEELPSLPGSFIYTHLSNLGDLGRGKSKHRPRNDPRLFGGKYPFIQTGEVKAAGHKITTFNQTYSEFGLAQSKLWPQGTLCITIAANIAETAFLDFEACFPDSVVGFTAYRLVMPQYIELFIKAVRVQIEAYAPATAQKNINLRTLEGLVVPYCSLVEQQEVVNQLEEKLSIIEQNEKEIESALAKAELLRQSILKKAFSGELLFER